MSQENRGFNVVADLDWQEISSTDSVAHIQFEGDRSVVLVIKIDPDRNIFGLAVDDQKNVVIRRTISSLEGGRCFMTNIGLSRTPTGVLYAKSPQNTINLLEVADSGQAVLWDVALVSQGGRDNFFVTIQRKYVFRCFKDGEGRLACPAFLEKWPEFVGRIAELTMDKVNGFAMVEEYEPEAEFDNSGLFDGQGRVLWYNLASGFGAVILANGETASAHWSKVKERFGRFMALTPGLVVTIDQVVPLTKPGGFRFAAVGVREDVSDIY